MSSARMTVVIDEALCDGCGLCLPSCHEGAIQIVNGKARLVEELCDGLGACLGECPKNAIRLEEKAEAPAPSPAEAPAPAAHAASAHGGCPGGQVRQLRPLPSLSRAGAPAPRSVEAPPFPAPGSGDSELSHWPVQIHLVPPQAPFLDGADVLVAADCVPVACANFHRDFLAGRAVMIGCPKFDDLEAYTEKFAQIFGAGRVRSVTVAAMQVPCCQSLPAAVIEGLRRSGRSTPVEIAIVALNGELLVRKPVTLASAR